MRNFPDTRVGALLSYRQVTTIAGNKSPFPSGIRDNLGMSGDLIVY